MKKTENYPLNFADDINKIDDPVDGIKLLGKKGFTPWLGIRAADLGEIQAIATHISSLHQTMLHIRQATKVPLFVVLHHTLSTWRWETVSRAAKATRRLRLERMLEVRTSVTEAAKRIRACCKMI